jgi:hypothetical protein
MFTTNRPFISYTSPGGAFTLNDCSIGLSIAFMSWVAAEGHAWNGTFMVLEGGSFLFTNTDFRDILVSSGNAFILATIELGKQFILEECSFVRCGCVNDGLVGGIGAPITIDLKSDSTTVDKFGMKNTTFKDCRGTDGNVQVVYVKGFYDQSYLFDSISIVYSVPVDHPIIFFDISGLPTTKQDIGSDITTRSKFNNLCDTVDDNNFIIGGISQNYTLKELMCSCLTLNNSGLCTGVPDVTDCVWIEPEEAEYHCQVIQNSCEAIEREIACNFTGSAKSGETQLDCFWLYNGDESEGNDGICKEKQDDEIECSDAKRQGQCSTITGINNLGSSKCVWVNDETTGHKCQQIQNSCESIEREITCNFLGASKLESPEMVLSCFWLHSSSEINGENGRCRERIDNDLECGDVKDHDQCLSGLEQTFLDGKCDVIDGECKITCEAIMVNTSCINRVDCSWVYDNNDANVYDGKCFPKNNTPECETFGRESQCYDGGGMVIASGTCEWYGEEECKTSCKNLVCYLYLHSHIYIYIYIYIYTNL